MNRVSEDFGRGPLAAPRGRNPRVPGLAVVAVALCVCACGGAAPAERTPVFAVPSELVPGASPIAARPRVAPQCLVGLDRLRCETGTACLDEAADRLRSAGATDLSTTADGDTSYLSALCDGAAVAVLVRAHAWTPEAVDAAVDHLYRAPQPTYTRALGDDLPFAIRYLTGGAWWGELELALYAGFADPALAPDDPRAALHIATEVLSAYGARPTSTADLDALLAALPRPASDDARYVPIGTLLALGLAAGELARSEAPRLQWVPGTEAMARQFALRDRSDPERIFRPIDFAVQAWRSRVPGAFTAYVELVTVRMRTAAEG